MRIASQNNTSNYAVLAKKTSAGKYKMRNVRSLFGIFILAFSLLFAIAPALASKKIYKIASGSILEAHYFIGLKLCKYIKQNEKDSACHVIPTSGSLESLSMLQKGEVDFAFVQSNIALKAYNQALESKTQNESANFKKLRQIMRLHDEVLTVLAKDDDHILVFADLEGKKISNGPPGSDSQETYELLEKQYHFDKQPEDIETPHENYAKILCSGKVDAILMMTSHPNSLVGYITSSCDTEFVPIDENKIDELVAQNPVFKKINLKAGEYPDIEQDQVTIGVSSMLVALEDMDKEIVMSLVDNIHNNPNDFKSSHPVLKSLPDDYFKKGFDLPRFLP